MTVLSACGDSLPVIKRAPDFTLQNIDGSDVRLRGLDGKVRLVEFMYTNCPDICPATTYNMVQIQKALKQEKLFAKQVHFISISFDTEHDTQEVLKQYADKLGVDRSGWSMLRGDQQKIDTILKDYGVMAVKQDDGSFVHNTNTLYLIDKEGNVRKIYKMGDKMDVKDLQKQIIRLAK